MAKHRAVIDVQSYGVEGSCLEARAQKACSDQLATAP
jgi:hypothetical protein